MAVYSLIFNKHEPVKIRFQAFVNLFCVLYLWTVNVTVIHTAIYTILPTCYNEQSWIIYTHRLAIGYLFTCVLSQFVTCIVTDAGINDNDKRPFSYDNLKARSGKSLKKEFMHASNDRMRIVCEDKSKDMNSSLANMHFCNQCNLIVHSRTHHCLLCKKCIIKRDHHCFFMGVCIGRANHLYFIYFTLYMGIGTFYGLLLLAKYMFYMYDIRFYGPQTFISLFLNTMLSLLKGSIPSARYLFTFIQLYLSLFGVMFALSFFFWHLLIVTRGQTTHEARRGNKSFSKDSRRGNIQEVFRRGSCITLLVPFWDLIMNKLSRDKQS